MKMLPLAVFVIIGVIIAHVNGIPWEEFEPAWTALIAKQVGSRSEFAKRRKFYISNLLTFVLEYHHDTKVPHKNLMEKHLRILEFLL